MRHHKNGQRKHGALWLLTLAAAIATSCTADSDLAGGDGRGDRTVRISASVTKGVETRSYLPSGTIESGLYYMTYPRIADNTTYSVCDVNFYDGYGITTTMDGKELKWQEIGASPKDNSKTVFYLDNVPRPDDDSEAVEVPLTAGYNPFVAGLFDEEGGSNDLLWGSAEPTLFTSDNISIAMHHYMSRVSVIVTVDNSAENAAQIDFTRGSVKITNVLKKGVAYNRLTGGIEFGEDPVYEDLEMAVGGNWGSVTYDEENRDIIHYQTLNYVLPPQELLADDNRPRLVLDVPQSDGSTKRYSGVIPRVMTVNGTPAVLGFDPEKNLTLHVKISADLLHVESIWATVQNWIDKGTFLVSGYQAGLYNDGYVSTLIWTYNNAPETDLRQFGYYNADREKWMFNVFATLSLKVADVAGKMADGPEFGFDMGTYGLALTLQDGTIRKYDTEAASEALYQLLRNGIVTPSDEE